MSASVFPARAGMSRGKLRARLNREGVPRASGDEPSYHTEGGFSLACSPRERG